MTPSFDLDGNITSFSDDELLAIQTMWEFASEDFRPFNVDVTTQDPGVANLINSGAGDQQWGVRVVIGGSDLDWQRPITNHPSGGIAYVGSFSWDTDTPCFVFAADYGGQFKQIAESISHETGHTLGLDHDGQTRFYFSTSDHMFHSVHVEYYYGHPAVFDELVDDMGNVTGYVLNPNPAPTGWAPIMGTGYDEELSQWSQGEYPGANNVQDDLAIISDLTTNGFGYRADDHGDTIATADPLTPDDPTASGDEVTYSGEGIIGEHPSLGVSDVDVFAFDVQELGEIVSLDINPFQTGPDLDVLAKLYDSSGTLIATSNPLDVLEAGSDSLNDPLTTTAADGGWRVQLNANGAVNLNPDQNGTWQYVDQLLLTAGTYYVSVEGAGKPITYIDPVISPGPITDPPGAPSNPQLQPDDSDWGYSNYGSLGYYSVVATRRRGLVVGVDFDQSDGVSPTNWNLYTGGGPNDTLKNLISEAGGLVPYQLEISATGSPINTFASGPINVADIPNHTPALDGLDGYLGSPDETLSFTWSNLTPSSVYQIYVFGTTDSNAENDVTVTGGTWNGVSQVFHFTQDGFESDGLVVNDNSPSSADLSTLSLFVVADASGQITITVNGTNGSPLAVAGLAIAPTSVGSISGQVWNDVNGNQTKDSGEAGLPDWIVYLDLNNNGQLDKTSSEDQTVTQASPDVPQAIQDYTTVKSELDFASVGQILDVNVTLDITHTYDADLHVSLISPSGTSVLLFANVGPTGANFHNTVLDDQALISINTGSAPFTGSFQPQEPLSAFNGENAFGAWKLEISDDGAGDVGVLNSWSLTIKLQGVTQYLEPVQTTDSNGNYTFTKIPPGVYYVREYETPEQFVEGWQQTSAPPPTTLRSGVRLEDIDIGNWIPVAQHGSIQGTVFDDANQNGMQDDGESGLSGSIVYIDSNHNGMRDIASTPTVIAATDLPKRILDFKTTTSQVTVDSLGSVFNIDSRLTLRTASSAT